MMRRRSKLSVAVALALVAGCGDDPTDTADGGDLVDAVVADVDAAAPATRGTVAFVPIYEAGSAWTANDEAQRMVERVFADFAANLRTSGDWDATVEVYLTDDNTNNANTTQPGMIEVMVDEQSVRVLPAWASLVRNVTNGPAEADGTNVEFTVHFNVADHADNDGLLRHEMMHGMGAINRLANFTVSETGERTGPVAGDRVEAALYDLLLVDGDGNRLLAGYDAGTFQVQPHRVEATLAEWMDGDGGIFFRGVADDGSPFDMACGTFPAGADRGVLLLNEPSDLMVASAHPTWNTLDAPDRAFLRAMGYSLASD